MNYLIHSSKGSSWNNHKYIKKVGNKYYYSQSQLDKANKAKDSEITKDTSDADIIKNSLGDDFENVRQKVLTKQKETGRTNLTDDEIKEILGDKYDDIKEKVTSQAEARTEVSKSSTTGKKKTKTTSKKKASTATSSSTSTTVKHSESANYLVHTCKEK